MRFGEEQQIDVIHLHTSGHADLTTLHEIVNACNPGRVIPVHTDCPARYSGEFVNAEILQDGPILDLR